ncbi:MAG: hypothetical protein M0T70_13935 [Geobacteraceae bacterium]|nr:hypothetical protein [Geobacteraceae bacterium]
MNILMISYLFPPIINPQGILGARLAKYLKKAGHHVTVIAGSEIDSYGSTHGTDSELMEDLKDIDVVYVRDRKRSGVINNLKNKIIYHENYHYWVKMVVEVAVPICKTKNIDIIYSLSAPLASNIAGMKVMQRTQIPWIAHFSDPTMLAIGLKFKSPIRTHLTYTDERALLKDSDGITFVNEDTLLRTTQQCQQYREKCIILPHFYDPDYYTQLQSPFDTGAKIRFTYVGSLYGRRNPFDAINALKMLIQNQPELLGRFEFNLYGVIDQEILKLLDCEKHEWLKIRGSVSYKESIRVMQSSDFLLLIDMPNVDNIFTPSKLIDYLAANIPIIGITPGNSNSARILNSIPYPVIEPGDVTGLCGCLQKSIINPQQGLSINHKIVAEAFKVENVVATLIGFMDTTIAGHSHGSK